MHRYFRINKPYGMESQFKENYPSALLGELDFAFPEGIHAIGRLDKNTEGLLLLTTNKKITKLLFQGDLAHKRTYLVQVQYKVSAEKLKLLQEGIEIRISGGDYYTTPPCEVSILEELPFDFPSPITVNTYIDTTWLQLSLTEGKYHQVRKMVAAAGHRCIRLVRWSIEELTLEDLKPGEVREIHEEDFFHLLRLGKVQ